MRSTASSTDRVPRAAHLTIRSSRSIAALITSASDRDGLIKPAIGIAITLERKIRLFIITSGQSNGGTDGARTRIVFRDREVPNPFRPRLQIRYPSVH